MYFQYEKSQKDNLKITSIFREQDVKKKFISTCSKSEVKYVLFRFELRAYHSRISHCLQKRAITHLRRTFFIRILKTFKNNNNKKHNTVKAP